MERAIPADKVASAPESPFLTSSVGDVGAGAGIFAGALDLRKRGITEADCQVKDDRDVTVTASDLRSTQWDATSPLRCVQNVGCSMSQETPS